jgi:flagellar biosynthesis/type III secretory pathway M-ring protein FliF/YscJ
VIENFWANAAYSLIPTLLIGLIFWLVMRSIFRADRTERTVYAEIEAEERARFVTENAEAENAAPENSALENAATEEAAAVGSTAAAAARERSA